MKKKIKIAVTLLLIALPLFINAQVRTRQTFEKGWKFTRQDKPDFSSKE